MKTWKQTCDRFLKENESANRAKAVGSHHKRKACDIGDFDEDVAVIAKCLRSDVEKANVPSHGFSDSLDDYPAMPLLTSAHKAEIVAFGTIPQLQTMLKWSSRELTKSDEQDFTSQFSNKKLLQEIEKVELLVSPQLACKTDLTFLPSQSELKRSIFSFQLTTLSHPHFDINVTSFALPEVRLQVLEAYALFLFPVGRVEGDTISEKIAKISNFSKSDLIDTCKAVGACAMVTPGQLVAIPGGWFVVSHGTTDGCNFVRWNFLRKDMFGRVAATLQSFLQALEVLKDTEYQALHDVISSHLGADDNA